MNNSSEWTEDSYNKIFQKYKSEDYFDEVEIVINYVKNLDAQPDGRVYKIQSLQIGEYNEQNDYFSELKNFIDLFNNILFGNSYPDDWQLFYVYKELFQFCIGKAKTGSCNYFRGQSHHYDLVPGILRGNVQNSYRKEFESLYLKIANEFPDKVSYFDFRSSDSIEQREYQLSLLQHYGLKTPALDWSTDPLVALYFALDKYEYIEDGPFPVVYILNPSILNKYAGLVISNEDEYSDIIEPLIVDELDDEDFMKLFKDLNNTPFSPTPLAVKSNLDLNCHRISRQSGVFTLHEARHLKSPEWFARSTDFGMVLKINPQKAVEIRKHLNLLNINEETIYGIGVDSKELSQIAEKIVNKTDII